MAFAEDKSQSLLFFLRFNLKCKEVYRVCVIYKVCVLRFCTCAYYMRACEHSTCAYCIVRVNTLCVCILHTCV